MTASTDLTREGLEAGRFERLIVLRCPDCGREVAVSRDVTDPPTAVRANLQCDRCDDGDFHSPEYFDGEGKWVNPVEHLDARARSNEETER